MTIGVIFKIAAFLTSFAGLILVLSWVLPYIYELFASMKRLFSL